MKSIGKLLLFITCLTLAETGLRFTNLKCQAFRPDFATFQRCELNVVGRDVISLNIHVNVIHEPVSNITMNLSLHKKVSGYRPFLYNHTVDYCQFQRNRKRYPFVKIFHDALLKHSNMNHTCPYDHDIIVDNLILQVDMFKYMPLPRGEYMYQMKVFVYNDLKADVKVYVAINSDL